jgi:hypothetical protein
VNPGGQITSESWLMASFLFDGKAHIAYLNSLHTP